MKPFHFLKTNLSELVTALLIFLFGYTAISKLLELSSFKAVLAISPLLHTVAPFLSLSIPVAELLVVMLLCFPASRLKGLCSSAALLTVFTIYIAYMLATASHLPCSCGGVIRKLSWKQHLLFNLVMIMVAFAGIGAYKKYEIKSLLQ